MTCSRICSPLTTKGIAMATDRDPYAGNVLVRGLGPIPTDRELIASLARLPPPPGDLTDVPRHVRTYMLMRVRDLHLPTLAERQLARTLDVSVRESYRRRDPLLSGTWRQLYGEVDGASPLLHGPLGAAVEGHSGVGKTVACLNCLRRLPQSIVHEDFPRLHGGLVQVVWQSVEVPPSGKASDLARQLMDQWDTTTGGDRFAKWRAKDSIRDSFQALSEWKQVASSHFLGVLHLDEIQNFFQFLSLKQRRSRKGGSESPELSIVEDRCLRWVLSLLNTGSFALAFSGTPDGMAALSRRLSTLSRISSMGYHSFDPFSDPAERTFRETFLDQLGQYQFVKRKLPVDDRLAELIVELTGGIQRLIVALWVAAHRVAFERKDDDLRIDDFTKAASTLLAPLAPAVAALRSGDARRMARYEDLAVRDTAFWSRFWGDPGTGLM